MTLSDKITTNLFDLVKLGDNEKGYLKKKDVKAFIKELKAELMFPIQDGALGEMIDFQNTEMFEKIDELAGDKLI